jgi:hypothetical protein
MRFPRKIRRLKRLPVFRQPLLAHVLRLRFAYHAPARGQFALLRPQAVLPLVVLQNDKLSLRIIERIAEFHTDSVIE